MFGLATLLATASVVFPGVQPQLAAVGERIYLAFGQGDVISVARSLDAGATFGTPSPLPVSGKLALGMRRGPRIAATARAVLVAAVVGARGGGADGDVVVFRSTDGSSTWAAPVVINDVPGAAREGLHAMAASPDGLVVIAWLDLREPGTRINAAVSRDHGTTWAPDALVYSSPSGSVCECCHPSVAIDDGGSIAIMFRNNVDGNRAGAIHIEWVRTLTPAGSLRPPEALQQLFAAAGIAPETAGRVVTYCGSGYRAAHAYLLLRILGHPDVANYAPSWNEWITRSRPCA